LVAVDMKKVSLLAVLLLFILSGGLFIGLFSDSVLVSGAVGNSWTTMAPMNQARGHLGVVSLDDKIYAIGGSLAFFASKESTVGTNECYDPSSNTWLTLTSMPTPRTDFAIAACDGNHY
jgi:N-acetylneuraminic acid mutarotase